MFNYGKDDGVIVRVFMPAGREIWQNPRRYYDYDVNILLFPISVSTDGEISSPYTIRRTTRRYFFQIIGDLEIEIFLPAT